MIVHDARDERASAERTYREFLEHRTCNYPGCRAEADGPRKGRDGAWTARCVAHKGRPLPTVPSPVADRKAALQPAGRRAPTPPAGPRRDVEYRTDTGPSAECLRLLRDVPDTTGNGHGGRRR
jgi:hypothetical protein